MGTTRDIECPTCGSPVGKACRSVRSGKPLADDHSSRRLISINEAAANGIPRLRKPKWASQFDHLKIDIVDGKCGPWVHLFAPFNKECNGRDPVDMLVGSRFIPHGSLDSQEFAPYTGPLPDSEEYRTEADKFNGVMA